MGRAAHSHASADSKCDGCYRLISPQIVPGLAHEHGTGLPSPPPKLRGCENIHMPGSMGNAQPTGPIPGQAGLSEMQPWVAGLWSFEGGLGGSSRPAEEQVVDRARGLS